VDPRQAQAQALLDQLVLNHHAAAGASPRLAQALQPLQALSLHDLLQHDTP
jgi:hypothetical protein